MRASRGRAIVVATPIPPEPLDAQSYEAPGISFVQVTSILRARLKHAALIFASIVVMAAGVIKFMPKSYTSTATMIVSYRVTQGGTEIPSWLIGTYMATQIELMHSPEVLLPVVDELSLDHDPEFTGGFRGGDSSALRNYASQALDKHVTVEQGKGSDLLYVTATSRNPARAAEIANSVADTYLKRERQRLKDPADDRARNYSDQLAELQAKVTAAQQKVTNLRQQTGTSPVSTENSSSSSSDADGQILAALEQQLLEAQNVRRAAESATNMGPVSANGAGSGSVEIKELTSEITAKELQLSQLSATYGARHPKVLEVQSDLNQARQKLAAANHNYLSDARQIEAKIQLAVDVERQKVLAVRKVQDQGAKLELELESAQSVYKRALDGYDQIMFATAGSPTNVSFVSRGTVPGDATKPNKPKLFLMGVLFALFAGLASPVMYELLFDRRLHCRDDFERYFGVPVLAEFGVASLELQTALK